MVGRGRSSAALAAFACALVPAAANAEVRAGAAAVDASWHVGAAAGQYAGDCVQGDDTELGCAAIDPANDNYDPAAHSVRRRPSYGIQSRLEARAVVIDDGPGAPAAIVKTDMYIPQDLLYRRAAQLVEASDDACGVTRETLTMAATHNHSSPMYSSTAWGVWAFQDVFDVRFFNYMAQRIAAAVERACAAMVPVRVGASVGQFDKTHRHAFGPAVADDGTPAGYPHSNTDHDLTVLRFDDISDPGAPKPLANLVNFSGHPEFLNGNDLISADYIGPLERMTDRATGAVTIWTQGAVGTAEPERSSVHSIHERLEFTHREYAQAEYGARLLSDAIIGVWDEIGAGDPATVVPFDDDFPVEMTDRWYPGPFSHPYPTVSNCRTDKGLTDPALPVIGLPDCQSAGVFDLQDGLADLSDSLGLPAPPPNVPGTDPGLDTDDFQALGIPVAENYSAPGYAGLQEDIDVHLQGLRLGEIYLPICSCEQWFDQSENIETRTDRVPGNEHLGFDWGAQCTPDPGSGTHVPYTVPTAGTGTWTCPRPGTGETLTVSDRRLRRMRAQVLNPANGWNNAEAAATAESEPTEASLIKGNYTHDDGCGAGPLTPGAGACGPGQTSASAALGYALTVPISMANDYNGYIATYREYQRGDHYRKALTAWGPHSSDYMASRLVTMGRQLRNPGVVLPTDQQQEQLLVAKAAADTAINDQRAAALGQAGTAAVAAYEALLPDEAGAGEAVSQPEDLERFGATTFTWNGGSNFTDNPRVRVERFAGGGWEPYADQSGELPVTLAFPKVSEGPAYLAGDQQWPWSAHFEAFVAPFDTGERALATPPGDYRFVVDGERREGGQVVPYRVESRTFTVQPWSGITAEDFRLDADGRLSIRIGPRSAYTVGGPDSDVLVEGGADPAIEAEIGPIDYPDTYDSPVRFIAGDRTAYRDPAAPADASRLEWFCFACSFRPWIDSGDAETAEVTVVDADGGAVVPARREDGRWVTDHRLQPGETAFVEAGGILDPYGNLNGSRSAVVSLDGPAAPPGADPAAPGPDDNGDGSAPGPPLGTGPCGQSLSGSAGADKLVGTGAGELLRGFGGRDRLAGRGGGDCVRGGADRDRLRGGGGGDRIAGGRGRDRVAAGRGADLIRVARGRADRVDCGPGRDRAFVGRGDTVRRCERVRRRRPATG